MNTIQFNKLSRYHNGKTCFFTKTDFLDKDFEIIKNLNNDVILITGNSDFCITENNTKDLPENIKVWYATNAITPHPKIINLPLGIENSVPCLRENHGNFYENAKIKDDIILTHQNKKPTGFIYSNFNILTNFHHRSIIKKICEKSPHIVWEEPNLNINSFFDKILDFTAVVCAQGNGDGDNHRIYETLYMDRIPITFNKKLYQLLHYNFPVVFLENPLLLTNYSYMKNQIIQAKLKKWDKNLLNIDYWESRILLQLNSII